MTVHLHDGQPTGGDEAATSGLDDTPIPDKLWDGLVAWMRGTFAVIGTALAISATLGYPRRAPGELSGSQVAFLIAQAVACSAFVVQSGRRLCRHYRGAVLVALAAGFPGALAVLMTVEWLERREPLASWWDLLTGSVRFAALEALPVGFLLWMLYQQTRWGETDALEESGAADQA
ncbi:MAG TPA: hypothetical protein VFP28_01455 [Gemmatimonadales bacterium]|nr:hypothetical protein [Gemmatimonadales bacterium]